MKPKRNMDEILRPGIRIRVKKSSASATTPWSMGVDFSDIVKKIVQLKNAVDVALHGEGPMPKDFAENWPEEWVSHSNTVDPDAFMRHIVPFAEDGPWGYALKTSGPLVAYLDPHLVIGESWRHWPPLLSEKDKDDFIANTDDQVQQCIREGEWGPHPCIEPPHFTEISPFGLYVADGGKNRIAVYQERNRLVGAHIHARIHFPEARRIALRRFVNGEVEAVLDRRHRITLRYATGLISDLLVRYGAEIV